MSDYDDQLEAARRAAMDEDADAAGQSCSVMGAAPVSPPPSQIPVDPFGPEAPGDGWWTVESEPPGYQPGNPLPVRPNDPVAPEPTPEAPAPEAPVEPIPATDPSPGVQPPGTETPSPEVPVQDAPPATETPAPEAPTPEPVEPGPTTLRSPGVEGAEGGEAATEAGVEGGEVAVEAGETAVEVGEGAELAEGGAALGELAPVAAAGVAGYALGSAIAPYVYGDKNLDGSPVVKYENADDVDPNYKDSMAYKINQWLDD
ncbi:MAG TPA: hypothetical protein VHW23_31680 [Kofleriaceae bacterium]|jgi:hypothetical protein|nr:hypothetical protein [Kofleriaceae bacterium]